MRRAALVALVAIACGAAATQNQDLRLAFHKGDTYKYTIHSTASETVDAGIVTLPIKVDMTANQSVTVNSVDSSGTANISVEMSNLSITTTTGQTNSTTKVPSQTLTMQVGTDGRVVSANGNALASNPFMAFSGIGGSFVSAVLPDRAVQPGDTWSKSYDQANTQGSGSIHVTADSKYLRDESLPGVNKAAVVETTTNSTIDMTIDMTKLAGGQTGSAIPGFPASPIQSITFKGTVKAITTTWVDPSTHRVAKSHRSSNIDASMTMNAAPDSAPSIPGLTGPFSIKGDETTDLTPA